GMALTEGERQGQQDRAAGQHRDRVRGERIAAWDALQDDRGLRDRDGPEQNEGETRDRDVRAQLVDEDERDPGQGDERADETPDPEPLLALGDREGEGDERRGRDQDRSRATGNAPEAGGDRREAAGEPDRAV